jgi:predicted transcriptional regulator
MDELRDRVDRLEAILRAAGLLPVAAVAESREEARKSAVDAFVRGDRGALARYAKKWCSQETNPGEGVR